MKTESDLHKYLKRKAAASDVFFSKLESRSHRGWPDCFLAHGGKVLLVELKSPSGKGRLHPLQKHCISQLNAHGVDTLVIDSAEGVALAIAKIKG